MAEKRKTNQPHFIFFCGNLDEQTFAVENFEGKDEVSTPYEFDLNLKSPKADIASDKVINKQATLYIYREGEYFTYSGVVAEFKYLGTSVDYSSYYVKLVPRLWLLNLNIQTRIFQNMSVPKVVEKVLKDANLSDYFQGRP